MTSTVTNSNVAITSLTACRGLAASWIVLYHFQPDLNRLLPQAAAMKPFLSQGHLAVPLFFILSGFVLSYGIAAGAICRIKVVGHKTDIHGG